MINSVFKAFVYIPVTLPSLSQLIAAYVRPLNPLSHVGPFSLSLAVSFLSKAELVLKTSTRVLQYLSMNASVCR